MVTFVLAAMVAVQQVGVVSSIDRERAVLGDTVTFTIRVEATSNLPLQIVDPIFSGLELLGSSEQTHVSLRGNTATRLTIREISLVARRIGTATIGSVVVHVEDSTTTTEQIAFTVDPAERPTALSLDPRVQEFVRRQRPSVVSEETAVVDLRVLADTVMLGDQLDVIVIAWFPRAVRSRLRTPPQLQPPQVRSAWGYRGNVLGVQAMSQRINGVWYDLYVHHQALFPLKSGPLSVGPASVTYNLPVTFSFLSRELRHEVPSESLHVFVEAQPLARRPVPFTGAAGESLRLNVSTSRTQLLVGDASIITLTLSGRGNVALWPEPVVRWPAGIRGYADDIVVTLQPNAGQIGGTKEFRYLVVADSSGAHRIPTPSYSYFDLAAKQYVMLRAQSIDIVATGDTRRTLAAASEVRQLLPGTGGLTLTQLVQTMPTLAWIACVFLPPIVALVARVRPTFNWRRRARARRADRELGVLRRDFWTMLETLVPEAHVKSAPELADALRAAGIDGSVAVHAAGVRDRLWRVGYGPEKSLDGEELAAEMHEMFRALTPRRVAPHVQTMLLLMAVFPLAGTAAAQSAERLYEAGAARAAADSFAVRADREPWNAVHWYNLGAALDRSGDVAEARAAWLRAARLEPRRRVVRNALRNTHADDPVSARVVWRSPITPAEALAGAIGLWLLGWILAAVRRPRTLVTVTLVMAAVLGVYGVYVQRRYDVPVGLVREGETSVRVAPYGSAAERVVLAEGSAVIVTRLEGGWVLIERAGTRGWMLRSEIIFL